MSGSSAGSHQSSTSNVLFPAQYISDAGQVLGQPLTLQELIAGIPQVAGLFSGGSFGTPRASYYSPATASGGATTPAYGSVPGAPSTYGPARPGASANELGPISGSPQATNPPLPTGSIVPTSGYPGFNQPTVLDPATTAPRARIPSYSDETGMGLFNTQGLVNTGIGAAPTSYQAPGTVLSGVNRIVPASATAATGTLGAGDYEALRQNLYKQAYDPVAQESARSGGIADRALQSDLANAGLASSGAGIGQIMRQRQERATQLANLSGQAATNAAVTTTGLQESELQANLARQQEANLANAGYSQQAQLQNAANVLAGNTTDAANYLATIGLNQKSAQDARNSFLQYLGIQEADVARMDASQRQNLTLALNAWLQQYATIGNIGRVGVSSGGSYTAGGGIAPGLLGSATSSGSGGGSAGGGEAAA